MKRGKTFYVLGGFALTVALYYTLLVLAAHLSITT
jgi:hypothetical protein